MLHLAALQSVPTPMAFWDFIWTFRDFCPLKMGKRLKDQMDYLTTGENVWETIRKYA